MENRKNILILDDEEGIRTFIADVLSARGFQIFMAADGEEGLRMLERQHLDLILMDINMPNMGGLSFYHRLSSVYDKSRHISVIVMTGEAGMKDVFEGLKISAILEKPFKIAELVSAVERALVPPAA